MAITKTVLGLVTTSLLTTAACTGGFSLGGNGGAGATTTGGGGQVAAGGGGEDPGSSYGGPAGGMAGDGGGAAADPGPAEPRWDDYAFAVRERGGTYWGTWTVTKLTTFKVGATCYQKMAQPDSDAVSQAGYQARSIHALAKKWTGDDWEAIENQRSDRKRDRKLVEPMVDAFGQRFHLTIAIEGDDCDVDRSAWWIRYWYSVTEALEDYPSQAGKMFITMNVSAAARDITSTVSEDGSTFELTVPRDFEAKQWDDKIEKPFRKNAAQI